MKHAAEVRGNVGAFTEYTEDLQGRVLCIYRVWAEAALYGTQNLWVFKIYTETEYLLTMSYVEYFQ